MLGWISVARCLSQHDLAYEAGVSRSYLRQLEKGSFYASSEVEPAELLKLPPRTPGS
jgi:transcriptional regulator with XRE-family HTH domain